jgi:hypothetical protein
MIFGLALLLLLLLLQLLQLLLLLLLPCAFCCRCLLRHMLRHQFIPPPDSTTIVRVSMVSRPF